MLPLYENIEDNLEIYQKKSPHVPPHLHKSLKCVYVTSGPLEFGVGLELYHMETHDFAVFFSELIHHYQVFDTESCQAVYFLAAPSLTGGYLQILEKSCPSSPVIKASMVHEDVKYALKSLMECLP